MRVPRLEAQQKSDIQGLRTYGVESGRDQCLGALRRRLPWNRRLTRVSGHRARSLRPRGAHGVRPQGRAEQRKWLCTHFGQVSGMVNPARMGGARSCERRTARVRAGGGRRRRPRPGRGGAGAGERLVHTRRSHFQPLAIAQAIFPPSSPNPDSINWRRRRFSYQGLYLCARLQERGSGTGDPIVHIRACHLGIVRTQKTQVGANSFSACDSTSAHQSAPVSSLSAVRESFAWSTWTRASSRARASAGSTSSGALLVAKCAAVWRIVAGLLARGAGVSTRLSSLPISTTTSRVACTGGVGYPVCPAGGARTMLLEGDRRALR